MKNIKTYIFLVVLFIVAFFSFRYIASSNINYVKEVCDNCSEERAVDYQRGTIHRSDSLIFLKQDSIGEIKTDIPPKLLNNRIYFLTDKRVVISYPLVKGKENKPTIIAKLPAAQPFISDFLVVNDSILIYSSPLNAELVEFNFKRNTHKVKNLLKNNFINPFPFLGLELRKTKTGFVFPYINRKEYEENSSFLGIYDEKYNHQASIGSFRVFGKKQYAPFYDSPIISNFNNEKFLVTSSSSDGVALYQMSKSEKELNLEKTFCFKNKVYGKVQENISDAQLSDFNLLNELYVTGSYVVSLKWIGKHLYRITKGEQSLTNKKGMINTIELSGWSLERYDMSKNRVTYCKIPAGKYRFTNNFILDNKLFFLSSNTNKIIYYVLS